MICHTRDYVDGCFVIEGRILKFSNGQMEASKSDMEFVSRIPVHHPIFDQNGGILNSAEGKNSPPKGRSQTRGRTE